MATIASMKTKVSLWYSLRTRATAFMLAISVMSLWSLTFYATSMLKSDMQSVLGEHLFQNVSFVASHVNDALSDRLSALEQTASQLDERLIDKPAALQTFLEQHPILLHLFNGGVFVTGADGTAIADVPLSNARIGTNYIDRESVAVPLNQGKTVIGRPAIGKKLGAPIVSIVAPIRNSAGAVIGTLVGTVNLGKPSFLDDIAQGHYGKTGGYLLNAPEYRLIVTATDKTRIMQPLPPPGVNRMLDRYMQGFEGYGIAENSRGEVELSAAKAIPVAGWLMAVVMPEEEAFAPVNDMQQRMLWATVLLTLLSGALTWWILKRQLSPLANTSQAMSALADSKQISQPLPVNRRDEIGLLIHGFNRILSLWSQHEAALKESQQNLTITLNSIGDAVIATDDSGRITQMNPVAEQLTAWPLADALGRPLAEVFRIVNATTRQSVNDPVHLVMAQGRVVGLANHTVLLAKDGKEYQVADSAAPIRNSAGAIVGVVLVFSDVTEQYQAQEALRAGENRFRSYFDQPLVGIAITSPEKGWIEANEHLCKMLGYSHDELTHLTWAAFTHPDDLEADVLQFERVLRGDIEGYALDKRFIRKDHSVIPVFLSVRCVRKANGSVDYFVALLQDISERKQAEAQANRQARRADALLQLPILAEELDEQAFLQRSLSLLENLTNSPVSFLHFVNEDEESIELVAWSQRTTNHYCHAAFDRHYPVSRAGIWADAVRKRAPVVCNDYETYPRKMGLPDGHAELIRFVSVPVIENGKVVMLTGVGNSGATYDEFDVESVQLISRDTLHIVQSRRSQLALLASLREKTSLLFEVHHRVKNNLQVINSLLRLEGFRSKDGEVKSVLQGMQSRVRSIALLHETIYRKGTFAAIDLGSYIGQIADECIKAWQTNQGTVQLRLEMGKLQVGLDQATPIGMLISELVSNSLKHAFPEGVTGEICIALQPLDEPSHWRLQVSDTGVGLPADFEVRRQNSLGLQLVTDLSVQMGGTLKFGPGPQALFSVDFEAEVPAPIVITLGGVRP